MTRTVFHFVTRDLAVVRERREEEKEEEGKTSRKKREEEKRTRMVRSFVMTVLLLYV